MNLMKGFFFNSNQKRWNKFYFFVLEVGSFSITIVVGAYSDKFNFFPLTIK